MMKEVICMVQELENMIQGFRYLVQRATRLLVSDTSCVQAARLESRTPWMLRKLTIDSHKPISLPI